MYLNLLKVDYNMWGLTDRTLVIRNHYDRNRSTNTSVKPVILFPAQNSAPTHCNILYTMIHTSYIPVACIVELSDNQGPEVTL